jgi:hypothetical protein
MEPPVSKRSPAEIGRTVRVVAPPSENCVDEGAAEAAVAGYRNGLSLNSSWAAKESWTVPDIDARTDELTSWRAK